MVYILHSLVCNTYFIYYFTIYNALFGLKSCFVLGLSFCMSCKSLNISQALIDKIVTFGMSNANRV